MSSLFATPEGLERLRKTTRDALRYCIEEDSRDTEHQREYKLWLLDVVSRFLHSDLMRLTTWNEGESRISACTRVGYPYHSHSSHSECKKILDRFLSFNGYNEVDKGEVPIADCDQCRLMRNLWT